MNTAREFFKKEAQRLLDSGKVNKPVCRYDDKAKRFSAEIAPNEGIKVYMREDNPHTDREGALLIYATWLANNLLSASLDENLCARDGFVLAWSLMQPDK